MRSVWWSVLFVVVACDAGGPRGPDCRAVGPALAGSGSHAAAYQQRCIDDKWSVEARTCFAAAKTREAQDDCSYKHLTRAQSDNLDALPRPIDPADAKRTAEAMAAMTRFKEAMCACTDAACAQRVSDDMMKYSQEMSRDTKEPPRMTEADQRAAAALGEEMAKCMQRAMTGSDGRPRAEMDVVPPDDKAGH